MATEALAGTLVLEDRTRFRGRLHGYAKSVSGEVVFNTGMVGYTEALTDPSYSGQILTLTYPLVGNYGVPPSFESGKIQATALVVSELAVDYSHASARGSLADWLRREEIPCLAGIDTRALTKRLRDKGAMLGNIVLDGQDVPFDDPNCRDLVAEVGSRDRIVYPGGDRTVVLVDCGAKASIVGKLRARGVTIIRVPSDYDFLGEDFDGVLVSNGPGDPRTCGETIRHLSRALRAQRPIMGICLGHQLL